MAFKKQYSNGKVTVYSCTMEDIVELAQQPFIKQRCHELRVEKAKHTHGKLEGPKMNFSAAACRGKRVLIDGYNRAEAYQRGLATVDEEVLLWEYQVPNLDAAVEKLYDQFDSRKALKGGRDRVNEGLRSAGFDVRDLVSGMLQQGPTPSAVLSASGLSCERRGAKQLVNAFRRLNRFGIVHNRHTVSAGVLAGFLAIAEYEPNEKMVETFVRGIHAEHYLAYDKAEMEIAKFHDFHDMRKGTSSCSGTKNVDSIRDKLLTVFLSYKRIIGDPGARSIRKLITLGEFVEVYNKAA
jgi:hypothetical protein